MAKKLHIRSLRVRFNSICGSISDDPLFLDDKLRTNRNAIGQGNVCSRCRTKMLKILDHPGQSITEYLKGK